MKRSGFTRPLRTLLAVSAMGLLYSPAAGAALDSGGGSRTGATLHSSADVGGGRSPLKYFRTVQTTWEVWLPFLGWTVVCESTRVECNKGGTNCPIGPQV